MAGQACREAQAQICYFCPFDVQIQSNCSHCLSNYKVYTYRSKPRLEAKGSWSTDTPHLKTYAKFMLIKTVQYSWKIDKNVNGAECVAAFLNLWGTTPLGSRIRYPPYQMFTLRFITVAELHLWRSNEIIVRFVGVTKIWGTVSKGHSLRKADNQALL